MREITAACADRYNGIVSRMLHRVEGLEVHPGSEPDSLSLNVNAGRRANFEVLSIPVLSQEKADELVRVWQDSAHSASRRSRLIATRYLSSATRELLRENGISWIEERFTSPNHRVAV
jgi:hypothetical protein